MGFTAHGTWTQKCFSDWYLKCVGLCVLSSLFTTCILSSLSKTAEETWKKIVLVTTTAECWHPEELLKINV